VDSIYVESLKYYPHTFSLQATLKLKQILLLCKFYYEQLMLSVDIILFS